MLWKYKAKFTREQPSRNEISRKLLCSFIEIALFHECSPVNSLHIFRTCFYKNTYGGLLLSSESSFILWFSRFKCFYSGVQIFLRFVVVFAKTFDIRFLEQAKKFIKLFLRWVTSSIYLCFLFYSSFFYGVWCVSTYITKN